MSKLIQVSSIKCFGGQQRVYSHFSPSVSCDMKFGVYFPPGFETKTRKYPVLYFLSGLTCTEQNFQIKSGFQRYAAEMNMIVVNPDTSPRGAGIEGEDDEWDFGTGAGFYLNATEEKWSKNYRMYNYVLELISLVEQEFVELIAKDQRIISGHSMGGHGALVLSLRNPNLFKAVGAFSPISNPSITPWGIKCFSRYLGENNKSEWEKYDATKLMNGYTGPDLHFRIDQGSEDQFLKDELKVINFVDACKAKNLPVEYVLWEGYDHSYFFVGTALKQHFEHLLKYVS